MKIIAKILLRKQRIAVTREGVATRAMHGAKSDWNRPRTHCKAGLPPVKLARHNLSH